MRVLFVCTANVARSRAAEVVFRELTGHRGYETRSAGTALNATRRLTTRQMAWADLVVGMDASHLVAIRRRWPRHLGKVRVLDVPDDYEPDEPELHEVLAQRIKTVLSEWL